MYKLLFTDKALKSLKYIPKPDAKKIINRLEMLSSEKEFGLDVKRLKNYPLAVFRLRVGDYRVLFDKHAELRVIEVIEIGHRKDIYK